MKVVASVQAKRSSSRGLIHYIAHSKVDGERESKGREIFNEYANKLEVEKANALLARGISGRRPDNGELHHLVISLKAEDFERLGADEQERHASFKKITRHLMKRFEQEIGTDRLNWAAAIHRNTENPHVHIAIQKEYFDSRLEKKRLNKIPTFLLPHYEKTKSGEKIFNEGLLITSATAKLEEILGEKEQLQNVSKQKSVTEKSQNQSSPRQENNQAKMTRSDNQPQVESEANINQERETLARAILAKYYLDKSQEIVSSLENHGDKRRCKIFDEITKKHRRISLFDLERRAEKNADQCIKKQDLTDPKAGESLKQKLIAEELAHNAAGIKRIKTILHNLLRKENQGLREHENEYKTIKPLAEKIRQNYRRQNKKLPIPNLTPEELEMLQTAALEKKDFRVAAYLERVRQELSLEHNKPTRTPEEISRLKAKQKITDLKIKLQQKQLQEFQERRQTFPVEVNGKKRTLREIESALRHHYEDEQKLTGKVRKLLGKIGLVELRSPLTQLTEMRTVIGGKLSEEKDLMEKNLTVEKALGTKLDEFYKNETYPGKEKIKSKFSASELAEVESLAFALKLADVYRDNWEQQKRLIETGTEKGRFNEETLKKRKENVLSGRAIAREILSEIEVTRTKEDLANFKKYRDFQKFEIKNDQTGKSRFVSLSEVGLNEKGSILDQTLEYFLESRDLRLMRHAVEKQVQEKAVKLRENIKSANNLLQVARDIANDFKTKTFFGGTGYHHPPILTPKELVTIELRIIQTNNPAEAKDLQKILERIDPSQAKDLSAILAGSRFETERFRQAETLQHNKASLPEKADVKSGLNHSNIQENKTENFDQERTR